MDQLKIGLFIKQLRKEKGLTQEQFAEELGVSRRTVSRWETGSNMPDLDILVEIADFFDVDLRELFDGERKCEKMNKDLESTVIKAAEYSNSEKSRMAKIILVYFVVGIFALIANAIMNMVGLEETFWIGFAKGATFGLAFVAMVFGILYTTGYLSKLSATKKRILSK